MAVPAYEEVGDFFPRLVDFDRPVIAVMARFGAEDLANGFPVGHINVYPGGGFRFGEVALGDANVGLDVFMDREDVGTFMEAAEEGRIVGGCDRGEGCCEIGARTLILGLMEGLEDGVHFSLVGSDSILIFFFSIGYFHVHSRSRMDYMSSQ